jgi:hypothetical protein
VVTLQTYVGEVPVWNVTRVMCYTLCYLMLFSSVSTAFNKKKNLFTSKLELNLRKKLVKCYIWSIALYGAETWTLRKVD